MSIQPTTPPGDLDAIAHLDAEPLEIPCSFPESLHDGPVPPAKYAIASRCCPKQLMPMCASCWLYLGTVGPLDCAKCGREFEHRNDVFAIVAQIGGL